MATRSPVRARIGTGAAALVPATALTVTAARGAGHWTWPIVGVAIAGIAVMVVALVLGRASLVGPALILLAAGYATRLAGLDPGLDGRTPLAAAGLVATGELAYLSIALRLPVVQARALVGERAAFAVFEGLGAAVVAAVVLAAAGLPAAGGAAGDAVGVIAAAVALGLVAFLSQRLRGHARR
jgi:hypothetical protein